jgi:O-methyltransferase involved in polyketide biosynthesis
VSWSIFLNQLLSERKRIHRNHHPDTLEPVEEVNVSENKAEKLGGISESLLFTLCFHAMESQRPDALIKDEKAVMVVKRMSDEGFYDFKRINRLHLSDANKVVFILRNRHFDNHARDFLTRYPACGVVHIGCGLDTRFERVDNGQVVWYDLDLPNVIELRRRYLGDEGKRYHILSCSVLDNIWLEAVSNRRTNPWLFLAKGVFMYLKETQVKTLILTLLDRFPGDELVFDVYSPVHVLRHNFQTLITTLDFQMRWGIWHGQEVERWGKGIRLLDEWGYLYSNEPRLAPLQWLRPIESLARTIRIYHFQLGEAVG